MPGLSRAEWLDHVEAFMEDEGMYTLYEAESLMLYLIREGRLERAHTMLVMPANSTGWFWHCLGRETGRIGHLFSPGAQRGPLGPGFRTH